MKEAPKAGDAMAVAVAYGPAADGCQAPRAYYEYAAADPAGIYATGGGSNVVVLAGKAMLGNVLFGSTRVSTAGVALQLHSATTASNLNWQDISASRVISYGANVPIVTFAGNVASNAATWTGTATYGFTASTQTVSGAALVFYTTNTMSTNAATVDMQMYNVAQFGASVLMQNPSTLTVSVSLSFA